MPFFGTATEGKSRHRQVRMPDGVFAAKSEWMHSGEDPVYSPTVFLVEQPPNYTVATHFHTQNEFQIVVQGGGLLGRHAISPITLHYAGAYTGYGPLVSGPEALFYFTFRPAYDPGPLYPDRNRDKLLRGPKLQLHGEPFTPAMPQDLAALGQSQVQDLITGRSDHCAAHLIRTPANQSWTGTAPPTECAGQFFFVVSGSIQAAGKELSRWESIYVSPEEGALTIAAGGAGAEVLLMQVPAMATEYLPRLPQHP